MKLTLCGSTRFRDDYEAANRALTLRGHVVYTVAHYGHHEGQLAPDVKETLDLVHLRKIVESDAVMLVGKDPDGAPYVGESTAREVKWAKLLDRGVFFWPDDLDAL